MHLHSTCCYCNIFEMYCAFRAKKKRYTIRILTSGDSMTGYSTQRLTIFPGGVLFWPIIPAIDTHKEECSNHRFL
jgi:hypothetical protein